jgi:hypothetical protein
MTSPYRIERDRGTKEARQQLAVLREKWPLAFPVQHQDVRPLAMGVARQVAAAMGWSLPYTLDAEAKDLAAKQLAKLAARKAAKNAVKTAAPGMVKPNPPSAPPTDTNTI